MQMHGPNLRGSDFASVLSATAIAFLRAMGPEPWGVIAGGRLRLFGEKQLDAMVKWIGQAASQRLGVYAAQPLREEQTRHLAVRAPRSFRPASMRLPASLIVSAEANWMLWTLNDPVPVEEARRLSAGLAKQCGGVPAVGEGIPLPGTIRYVAGGAGLVARHQVRMLPPIQRAYRITGGELAAVAVTGAEPDDDFQRADRLDVAAMSWLWPGVLPAGEFALLAGPPKVGKSTIAIDMAARLTNGAAWPDGAPGAAPGGVILMECEDPLAATQSRLLAAGAAMGHVMLSNMPRDLSQPDGIALIERQRVKLQGAGLLILSPVRLFFGDMETARQVDLRNRLAPLLAWASAHGVTVLGIAHRESGKGGRSAEDVAGPRVFAQRARMVLSALIDPTDRLARSNPNAARRMLTTAGSNLAPDALEIPYRIVSVGDSSRVAYEASRR